MPLTAKASDGKNNPRKNKEIAHVIKKKTVSGHEMAKGKLAAVTFFL